ncbi:MAG: peptidoglycan-associated lipoprotein Pal [candidate division Zixibacteria bacterium]|nr:peptidoglycan-associated lipoprotein Pal [candidate division Zixibacteria bacterium]
MRKALILLSILMIALLAVGCGQKPKMEDQTPPPVTDTGTKPGTGEGETPSTPPVSGDQVLNYVTIYFDFDKYNLRDDAKNGLRQNFERMKANPQAKVLIEGHCDERGTVEYNLALGERRARSAMEYLASLGIPRDRMSIISYGKERPAVLGSSEDAWAKNRRAEFVEQ